MPEDCCIDCVWSEENILSYLRDGVRKFYGSKNGDRLQENTIKYIAKEIPFLVGGRLRNYSDKKE